MGSKGFFRVTLAGNGSEWVHIQEVLRQRVHRWLHCGFYCRLSDFVLPGRPFSFHWARASIGFHVVFKISLRAVLEQRFEFVIVAIHQLLHGRVAKGRLQSVPSTGKLGKTR